MIHAGIIGATGYAGAELVRILMNHPNVEIAALSSVSFEGEDMAGVYPNFYQLLKASLVTADEVIEKSDVVFGCVPHGLSETYADQCKKAGAVFIDLGADFRLHDEAVYQKWYGATFQKPELHGEAVYALPELNREKIKTCDVIGNPGCYPTSIALGLFPALQKGFVTGEGLVIDSKSGVTGAGRGLSQTSHYPDCNEAFSPYKVAAHRHTPEIEQTLSTMAGKDVKVTFVPHLLPVNRGIISTMYARLQGEQTLEEIHAAYTAFYKEEPFVRVLPLGTVANLKNVKYSNYCDISLHMDSHTGTLVVVAAIDNMVKGAAGQAVQNMNIRFGFEETAGLTLVPPAF